MDYSMLQQRLSDEKQLTRITAPTLQAYNQALQYPNRVPSWKQREDHMCARLIESGFTKTEIQDIYDNYPVGDHYREQEDRKQYFEDMYNTAVANVKFSANFKGVNVNHKR